MTLSSKVHVLDISIEVKELVNVKTPVRFKRVKSPSFLRGIEQAIKMLMRLICKTSERTSSQQFGEAFE